MPYLSSEAATRAMHREWPWVSAGGAALAAVAGFVNACVLGAFHVPVSYVTGAVSQLSLDVATANTAGVGTVAALVAGFVLGAAVSGAVVGGTALRPGRRYGAVLVAEGVALALAAVLIGPSTTAGVALAAFACGLQNAMASSYYGLVLRTTHLTGVATDLGVLLGQRLRGRAVPVWKWAILGAVAAGFFAGGLAGVVAAAAVGARALALPAAACLVAGALYAARVDASRVARSSRGRRPPASRPPGPTRRRW